MDGRKIQSLMLVFSIGVAVQAQCLQAQEAATVSLSSYNELLDRVERLESTNSGPIYSTSDACQNYESCNSCENSCGSFFFNTEFVLVAPKFGSNTAYIDEGRDILGSGEDTISTEFDWSLEPSVRFETGYAPQHSGMGWRARYWYFDADQGQLGLDGDFEANFADDSDVDVDAEDIWAAQSIRMHVIDLEATNRWTVQNTNVTSSAGIRYANANIHGFYADLGDLDEFVIVRNDFEGFGPTVSLDLRRNVYSHLSVFANTRGSVLFGNKNYLQVDDPDLNFFDAPQDINVVRQKNEVVPVAEIQIGALWDQPTSFGSMFLSVAWESQFWAGLGNSGANEGSSGDSSDFQSQRRSDAGFHGITVSTGLRW